MDNTSLESNLILIEVNYRNMLKYITTLEEKHLNYYQLIQLVLLLEYKMKWQQIIAVLKKPIEKKINILIKKYT